MKNISRLIILFICVLSFQGCIAQSIYPFFTSDAVIESPIPTGEWLPVDENGKPEDIKPWIFTENDILTHEEGGISGTVNVVYFKVNDSIFIDVTAAEPNNEMSFYWMMNMIPIHTLCKVEFNNKTLVLKPMDYSWLAKSITDKTINISHLQEEKTGDPLLFTATPEEWMNFLKEHKSNTELFSGEDVLSFIKQTK